MTTVHLAQIIVEDGQRRAVNLCNGEPFVATSENDPGPMELCSACAKAAAGKPRQTVGRR
jgi:hypothetical protein